MNLPAAERREVSCRALTFFFEWLNTRGMPPLAILHDLAHRPDWYQNQLNWISLDTLRIIETRFAALFPDEPDLFYKLGRSFASTRGFGFMRVVVGGLLSPHQAYWQFPRMVPAFLFPFVTIRYQRRGPGEASLRYSFHDGYTPSAAFLETIRGILAGVPGMFNQADAAVQMHKLDASTYVFDVTTAPQTGLGERVFGPLRAFWFWFRNRRVNLLEAHTSLVETNRALQDRADQLAAAKLELDDRVRELSVLNALATAATLELEPRRVARESAAVLSASFAASPVVILLAEGQPPGLVMAGAANAAAWNDAFVQLADPTDERVPQLLDAPGPDLLDVDGSPWQVVPLTSHNRRIGVLALGAAQPEDLVLAIAAQLSVAIDNAQAHQHLSELRRHLELRVRERTAELEEARTQLENTVVELRRSDQARTEFFTNLSHDLATPLTLILAPLDSIQAKVPPEGAREISAIRKNALHLSRLVHDLLDLARAEGGRLPIDRQRVDVGLIAQDVVEALRPIAVRAGVNLAFEPPREPLVVSGGDARLLRRVLVNLISNAIKYVNRDDHIVVCGGTRGGELRIDVIDDGPGIPVAEQTRVFERFYRSPRAEARTTDGTGLGLPLSRQIAQTHGGDIELESTPGRGCRFRLRLPRTDLPAESIEDPAQPSTTEMALLAAAAEPEINFADERPGHRGNVKTRVLVVEDNSEMRAYVSSMIAGHHSVITARDGREGLELARKEQPDAIVTDLSMPELDGLQLCRALREDALTRHLPVILLTAHHDTESAVEGLRAGADDFVRKPFSSTELLARIDAQIRIRSLALTLMRMEKRTTLGMLGGGIAHEVLNPLNALMNLLEPLRMVLTRALAGEHDEQDRAEGPRIMMSIEVAAERIQRVVEALYRFTRQDESVRIREVDIVDGIETVLALLAWRMGDKVTIHREFRYRAPTQCSPELVDQVVMNLVVNAMDALNNDGDIWISVDRVEDHLEIRVRDNGPGVDPELRERVFAPFFTTKDPGKGTGLGLAISREIATIHGGSLELARGTDTGAEFILSLPLTPRTRHALRTDASLAATSRPADFFH